MKNSINKIIPASTVLIIRDGESGLEVFMVVRHHEIDFAAGALVFPGGKVDKSEISFDLKSLLSFQLENYIKVKNFKSSAIRIIVIKL